MATITPIFRIFDYNKAVEFYIEWLGFKIDWEDKPDNAPIYMQISLDSYQKYLTSFNFLNLRITIYKKHNQLHGQFTPIALSCHPGNLFHN